MSSLRLLLLFLGIYVMLLMACAPSMPKKHGLCKFYVDGTSDTAIGGGGGAGSAMDSTEMLMSDSSSSSSSSSSNSSSSSSSSSSASSSSSSSSAAGGGGAGGKFTTTKKKKNVKCYQYEDGTKDDGAVLNNGVTYSATATSG